MRAMRGSSGSIYSPRARDPVVVEVEHERQRVGERQEVVEAVADLVVLDRDQVPRGLREVREARPQTLGADRPRAAMDVDVRAVRMPSGSRSRAGS